MEFPLSIRVPFRMLLREKLWPQWRREWRPRERQTKSHREVYRKARAR